MKALKRIHQLTRKSLLFIVILALPHQVMASVLSCPRMTHDESIDRYQNLTLALGQPLWRGDIQADVFNRFGKAPGYIENEEERMQVIHGLLQQIEKEIVKSALKATVDSLYFVYDERELKNSRFRLDARRIPSHAANLLCQSACKVMSRNELVEFGKEIISDHERLHTPRFSIEEVARDIGINFEGLNSILNYRTKENSIDLAAYKEHYVQLKASFPGFLLNTKILTNHFGGALSLADFDLEGRAFINPTHKTKVAPWKVKRALRQHYEDLQIKWRDFNHQSLFQYRWYDKLNLYGIINIIEGRDNFEQVPPYFERLLLLSKYMASAPMAVAKALNNTPLFFSHLCWIIEDMDRVTSSWYIQSSVNNLNAYLMPLTIGVLLFTGPFSTTAFVAGLIFLNVVTAIDLAKRKAENNERIREKNWHDRVSGTELEDYHTRETIMDLEATIAKEKWMMGVILTMELASLGIAKGFSSYAKKVADRMSESQKHSKLMRPFYRNAGTRVGPGKRNWRVIHARQETNSFINKVIRKNERAYDKAMQNHDGPLTSSLDVTAFKLSFALKNAKKEDAMKLLLSSKTTGFGMLGLNVELASEAIEQIIVHLNTPAMTDFTALNILMRVMTHDY